MNLLQTLRGFIKDEYRDPGQIALTNENTLRKTVGLLGMLLPVLLPLFLFVDTGYPYPIESISHYYYTRVCGFFLIIVSMMAVFLMIYKGKARADFWLSNIAGVAALLLLMFPTGNIPANDTSFLTSVTWLKQSEFREKFHYSCAAVFLICLAVMALVLFTRSDKPAGKRNPRKVLRNRIYRVCAALMFAAMAVVLAGYMGWIPASYYDSRHLTFWMETVAVESFGLAWIIKAKMIPFLNDKNEVKTETASPALRTIVTDPPEVAR